jgi:multiple sugar transport system substrate-binding protein
MTGIHSPGGSIARRTVLKAGAAGGLGLAALADLAACGNNGGGSSSKSLKMLYFGEQAAATQLQNRLQPQISKLHHQVRDLRHQRHRLERLPREGAHPDRGRDPAGHHQRCH